MISFYNKIITALKDFYKYLTFKKILDAYTTLLSAIRDILKVFARFVSSLLNPLIDYLNLEVKQIFKLIFVFAFYSKMILILSTSITIPSVFLTIAEEYLSVSQNVISGTLKFIEKIGKYYYDDNISVQHLKEEQLYLRELLSKQSEELNQEKRYAKDLQEKHNLNISELQAEMQHRDATNKKLSIENLELAEKVKVSKITTKVETVEKFLMVGGNLVFIAIQCLNTYNRLFQKTSVDPEEFDRLMKLVQSLINRLNTTRVNQTAAQRAQASNEDSTTGRPGLTSGPINFNDEFGGGDD